MVDTVENQICGIKTNFRSPSRMQRTENKKRRWIDTEGRDQKLNIQTISKNKTKMNGKERFKGQGGELGNTEERFLSTEQKDLLRINQN